MAQVFVGREQHLQQLIRCADAARSATPTLVSVEGEPGIGKSTLVQTWLASPHTADFTVLHAECDTTRSDLPFGAIAQLVAKAAVTDDADLTLLTEPAPSTPAFQVGAQLLDLLGRTQAAGPVALVIDDVQWADRASLQALGFVLRRLTADTVMTVLILRTGREEDPTEDARENEARKLVADNDHSYTIALTGLDTPDVARLAHQAVGERVTSGGAEQLQRHTGGNPLYLRMLLAELPADDVTRGILRAPASLAAAVHDHLAALPPQSRALVEAAAILDTPTALAVVAEIAGTPDPTTALDAALTAGLLRWQPTEPATPIALRHALQRQAILDAMPVPQKRALHAAAAPLVDHDSSWAHRVAAAEGPDSQLTFSLSEEAAALAEQGHLEKAARLLELAAQTSPEPEQQESFLLSAAAHLMTAEHFTRVQNLLPRIHACAPSPLKSLVLGAYATSRGDIAQGRPLLQDALTGGQIPGQGWAAAMAGIWLGRLYTLSADGPSLIAASQATLTSGAAHGALASYATANLALGHAFTRDPTAGLRQLSDLPHASTVEPSDAILLTYRGSLHTWSGYLTAAVTDLTTALQISKRTGAPALAEFIHPTLAAAQYALGMWQDSTTNADHGLAIVTTEDKPWALAPGYVMASLARSSRGHYQEAQRLLTEAEQWAHAVGLGFWLPVIAVGRGVLAQAKGDPTATLQALDLLHHPDAGQGGVNLTQAWWRPLHVQALTEAGHLTAAQTALDALGTYATTTNRLHTTHAWLTGRLLEQQGDTGAALTTYADALAQPIPADDIPLHRALLEHSHGRALASAGQPTEALTWFAQAKDRLAALGATPFLDRCQTDLIQLRPTTSTPKPTIWEDLNDRERGIANLLGRGRTNREIAAELFVSEKTVEYHLSKVYARLRLSGRRQFRSLIQDQAPPT